MRISWWRRLKGEALLEDESGQTTAEYALLAFWTVFMLLLVLEYMREILPCFYQDVASLICLPIP